MYDRIIISIDGACRRNGKPDCVSAGGVFIQKFMSGNTEPICEVYQREEYGSTNQRGEMQALMVVFRKLVQLAEELSVDNRSIGDVYIITDSEYLFNTMTRRWYANWQGQDWRTASGSPVKNADLWVRILAHYEALVDIFNVEPTFYHIKGHIMPFGIVTATRLLDKDATGGSLLNACKAQYTNFELRKQDKLEAAQELSERNNGFRFTPDILREFTAANMVADLVATRAVDAANQQS